MCGQKKWFFGGGGITLEYMERGCQASRWDTCVPREKMKAKSSMGTEHGLKTLWGFLGREGHLVNFQIEAKLGVEKHNLEGVIITVKREGTGQGGVRPQPRQLQGLQRSIWATEWSSSLTCPVRSFSDTKKTEATSASSVTEGGCHRTAASSLSDRILKVIVLGEGDR